MEEQQKKFEWLTNKKGGAILQAQGGVDSQLDYDKWKTLVVKERGKVTGVIPIEENAYFRGIDVSQDNMLEIEYDVLGRKPTLYCCFSGLPRRYYAVEFPLKILLGEFVNGKIGVDSERSHVNSEYGAGYDLIKIKMPDYYSYISVFAGYRDDFSVSIKEYHQFDDENGTYINALVRIEFGSSAF